MINKKSADTDIMNKMEKIRKIYAIVLSVFIVAMGIALICVAADIYYSGKGTGVIYSREIVGARLEQLAIPLLILIAAIIAGVIFPVCQTKAKRTSEETLLKLQRRIPANGDGEEFLSAQQNYRKMNVIKLVVWCFALAIALAGSIVTLVYLADAAHFEGSDFAGHMIGLAKVALPCTLIAFAALLAASFTNGYCSKKQTDSIKTMIKCGSREIALPKELALYDSVAKVASHDITLWVIRGAVFVIAVAFIIAGIFNGGARDVLIKAINICTECIGLG